MNKVYLLREKTSLEAYYCGEKNGEAAVLFLHGAGAHPLQFKKQLEYFGEKHFALSIGLHGHSSHFKNRRYDLEEFRLSKLADDIFFALDSIGVNRVHLVGNSAGGLTGYEMLRKSPQRIMSLVTFGTTPKLSFPGWMVRLISKIDKQMLRRKPENYLRLAVERSTPNKHVVNHMIDLMRESIHIAHLIRATIGRYNYLDLLKNLEIPYLIIKGMHDHSINKCLKRAAKCIRVNDKISTTSFQQSGHFVNLDECDLFNKTVIEFIENS